MAILITGVANEKSIATQIARDASLEGRVIATYLDEKTKKYAWPAIESCVAEVDYLPLDMRKPEELEAVVEHIRSRGLELSFVLHSMAFAPAVDLNGRVIDSSLDGMLQAVDISCHSLCRLAKAVEHIMAPGGSIVTLSYLGGERVVPGYGIMGPCKAMLESMVRWLAYEMGHSKGVRVNAVSPGPVATRAASGIAGFQGIVERNAVSPCGMASLEDIAQAVINIGIYSPGITGQVIYVDGGYSVMAA